MRLTTETEDLRHEYSSKNPGRSKVQKFPPKNPRKRAKKRGTTKVKVIKARN